VAYAGTLESLDAVRACRGDENRADGFHCVGKIGIPPPKHHNTVPLKRAKLLSRAECDGTTADHDHDRIVRRWHVRRLQSTGSGG
jgi:hypothetical protein